MDVARVILRVARAYTITLVALAIVTGVWIVNPSLGESPISAGLWFAIAGFGLLVGVMFLLVHASR